MMRITLVVLPLVVLLLGGVWLMNRPTPSTSENTTASIFYSNTNSSTDGYTGSDSAATDTSIQTSVTNNVQAQKKYMNAILHTNKGDITIEFNPEAPNTVENFTKLAGSGFYNGVKFHRVIKGFMIQGGDPLSKDDAQMGRWGTGGPGYTFADEIHANNKNNSGTISMANAGPNTNGSQFFINTANNNFLDAKHTVFGKVVSGMEVVSAIENTQTSANDRPVTPMIINSVELK